MAKQIARLLKTDVMADIDIPAIAQFLQSQGRRGDTILAHINAKEAEMLKQMGGAEERNPVTGLPEYFTIDSDYTYGANPYPNLPTRTSSDGTYNYIEPTNISNSNEFYRYQPPRQGSNPSEMTNFDVEASRSPFYGEYGGYSTPAAYEAPTLTPSGIDPTEYYAIQSAASPSTPYEIDEAQFRANFPTKYTGQSFPTQADVERSANIAKATTLSPRDIALGQDRVQNQIDRARFEKVAREAGIPDDAGSAPGIMNRASAYTGLSKEALARLGLAGIGTYQGIMAAREASEQGRKARRETEALARPYQQRGEALIQQAQSGELTAAGQQQLQALRARLAQGAEGRGGVGAAQAAAQVEAFRQNLLQNQFDYGQKISNIGDQLMLGAIRTGLEADRYAAGLSNTYFTNMASIAAGLPPSMPVQQRGE
jgi:hypothetical protein